MEQNEDYKALCDLISQFENQLHSVGQQQDFNLMRRRIEEHFERYIHALEVRRDLLLGQLDELALQHWEKTEKIEDKLKQYVQTCNDVLTTGSKLYPEYPGSAVRIWQEALALPKPSVSIDETKVDITITLPDNLGDVIDSHGAINIPATNPPIPTNISIEQDSVSEVSIPTNISANVNFERFSVVDRVSTIAGGKIYAYEDGTGPNAMFCYPFGICFNPNDDCFYVCDSNNHAIRRVTLNGRVSTLVQDKEKENFSYPHGIVVSTIENCLFVCVSCGNYKGYKIIKISMTGEITPLAGSGKGYKDGEGWHASFAFPDSIAIECPSGNLFVVDGSNHVIRLITPQGKVSTFAGSTKGFADGPSTQAQFNIPRGLCIDVDQSLLVCDFRNNKIRRVSHNGDVSTVCTINKPNQVAITANGVILVSSTDHKIFKVTKQETGAYEAEVFAGTGEYGQLDGKASECEFASPWGIIIHEPSHSCYITNEHSIRKIDFL